MKIINWEPWEEPAHFEVVGEGWFSPELPNNWFRIEDPKLPRLQKGWTYRVSLDGKYYLVHSLPENNKVIPIQIRFGKDQTNYGMIEKKSPAECLLA